MTYSPLPTIFHFRLEIGGIGQIPCYLCLHIAVEPGLQLGAVLSGINQDRLFGKDRHDLPKAR